MITVLIVNTKTGERKGRLIPVQHSLKKYYNGALRAQVRLIGIKVPSFNKSPESAFNLLDKSFSNPGRKKAEQTLIVCLEAQAISELKSK